MTPIVIANSFAGTNPFELGAYIPRPKAWTPPGNHFVTETATVYLNLKFSRDLPGSTKEIKQDVSNHLWWISLLAKAIITHDEEYEGCCYLGRQDFSCTTSGPLDSRLCHVQEWQILITYLPVPVEFWTLL